MVLSQSLATLLAALVAALVSIGTYIASKRTEAQVRDQQQQLATALAEHQTAFEGVYTRRSDIIAQLYQQITDLDALLKSWLKLDRTIADQKQKSKESEEYREGLKQGIEEMEQLQLEAYAMMMSKQSELETFYRRNQVWFTPATSEKLDYFVEKQDEFVKRLNPIERREWLEIAKPIDTLGERLNATMNKFGIAEEQSQTSLVEQIESSNRWAEEYYVPALDAALQSIEDEFRRVMRVR